jgi:hypothetical protein
MISTLAELNEFHRQYWAKQKLLLERRTLDPEILSAGIDQLEADRLGGIPIGYWKSFESALEDAEKAKLRFGLARKGGKAKKPDSLQRLILDIVRANPGITASGLLAELEKRRGGDVIQEFNRQDIHCRQDSHNTKNTITEYRAKRSGLKHRLTRARRTIEQEMRSR